MPTTRASDRRYTCLIKPNKRYNKFFNNNFDCFHSSIRISLICIFLELILSVININKSILLNSDMFCLKSSRMLRLTRFLTTDNLTAFLDICIPSLECSILFDLKQRVLFGNLIFFVVLKLSNKGLSILSWKLLPREGLTKDKGRLCLLLFLRLVQHAQKLSSCET